MSTMTEQKRRVPTSTIVRAVLALGTVLGIGTVLTLAAWTDNGSAQATFSTGSIDIKLDGSDGNPTAYDWTNLSASGMGDGTSKYANLVVSNGGTLNFTYQLGVTNSSGDAGLYGALRVSATVVPDATTCDASGIAAGAGRTVLFTDVAFGSATFAAARSLAAGAHETVCFRVTLPSGSASTLQSKTTTANFLFTATQS